MTDTATTFPYVVEITTDKKNGVTLKALKSWLPDAGYKNKVDYRHCGTKRKMITDIVTFNIPAQPLQLNQLYDSYQAQYNRFRFLREEDAIAFKLAW